MLSIGTVLRCFESGYVLSQCVIPSYTRPHGLWSIGNCYQVHMIHHNAYSRLYN